MNELEAIRQIIDNAHELGRIIVFNKGLADDEKAKVEECVRNIIAAGYTRLNVIDCGPPKTDLKSLM